MSATSGSIRSTRFRDEREAGWKRLAEIVEAAEKRGLSRLSFDDARDLVMLYRQAVNSLSVAREISLDAAVVRYLESLCARAYLVVYAPREGLRGLLARFFARSAPQAVRRSFVPILVSFALMGLGGLAAYLLTNADSTWFYAFVPGDLAAGRGPGASAEALRRVIYGEDRQPLGELGAFATYLFSHNTKVALFAFALGVVFCVPSVLLLIYNGAMLGTFVSVHAEKGLALDFMGWVTIHGVTELSAIAIASAGGLTLGYAMLFPGLRSRAAALRHAGRDAAKLAVVAAVMLVAAGILEGVGRQLVTDFWARLAVGWGAGLGWLGWFVLAGRGGPGPAGAGGAEA
ncbi:stage II sporulation protein M [Jiella sonneratiae]|uniref:Stage II sporulation protein M n=1 Tax=Jiella sonneratiae TaxID=2816856 RepID=A0ABS3J765_9HYPH|nr:stage II sporulation protein M [Jiella sonneratiae]MBO0905504.1 stage II sporulation protein M [Jiella sonneratiae]